MADISNNVVAILLVLVVVVSALGTWAFLSAFEPVPVSDAEGPRNAQVGLAIGDSPAPDTDENAQVGLYIIPAEDQ